MNRPPGSVRRRATLLVSAAIVISLYVATRERALSKVESQEVVNNFRFSRTPLPEVADHPPYKYVRGWVERRMASLTRLAYDLSYEHQPRHSPAQLLDRLGVLFERLGAPTVPHVFNWLSRSPVVLEGVLEMIEVNVMSAGVRFDLLKEAVGIAVASRAMPGSGLSMTVDEWLSQGSLPDSSTLRSSAARSGVASGSCLVSACRRYAWQVANAAYMISDEQISKIFALGLLDAELLDLTLATALFSALAIIEPISAAVAPIPIARG